MAKVQVTLQYEGVDWFNIDGFDVLGKLKRRVLKCGLAWNISYDGLVL